MLFTNWFRNKVSNSLTSLKNCFCAPAESIYFVLFWCYINTRKKWRFYVQVHSLCWNSDKFIINLIFIRPEITKIEITCIATFLIGHFNFVRRRNNHQRKHPRSFCDSYRTVIGNTSSGALPESSKKAHISVKNRIV